MDKMPLEGLLGLFAGRFVVGSGYGLEQDTMQKGAQAVDEATALIRQHMQQLNTEVETMFGGWRSQAQGSFAVLHENWVSQQTKLHTALQEMHAALVQTATTYAGQEEHQASQFNNIAGQL
jgi:WXG100 family type VII secretion target